MRNDDQTAATLAGKLAEFSNGLGHGERMLFGVRLAAAQQTTEVAGYGDGDREPGLYGREDIGGALNSPLVTPTFGVGWQQLEATKINQAADFHRR